MPDCEQCGDSTLNPPTMIDGEMQRLCPECNENAQNDSHEISSESDADHAEQKTEPQPLQEGAGWEVESIREEWQALNVRLPPYLHRRFNGYYKRLDYKLLDKPEVDFKKDRHYKPLVIAFGLRAVEDLDADEIAQALRDLQRNELVE